jgi:L-ribulose-5-phosphate 3-epimerase
MNLDRRQFLYTAGTAVCASLVPDSATAATPRARREPRVAMTDWNLNSTADPIRIPLAAQVGLDGVQVSVGTTPDNIPLRDAGIRRQYLQLGERHRIAYPSTAAGAILNRIPLRSEPQAAVYVIDAVEAAAALGATNILIAFFSNGDLRLRDAMGELRNVSTGPHKEYALDEQGVTRVVEALRQIAPRARDAGILLGLENTLTARQNLEILDRIGSEMVKVYYDVGNSTSYGYDVPGEIRLLGRELICEVHIKETLGLNDPNARLLGGPASGGVDFPAVAAACRAIGYDRWYVLETSGREGRFEEDTRTNIEFVKRMFG